jgi:heat shock protein HslJ
MSAKHYLSTAAVALALAGASACTPPPEEPTTPMLTGAVWELQQIQYNNDTQLVPDAPENYAIEFLEDGSVGIQADCNRVLGEYTTDNSSISITLGPSTLAACGPDSKDTEFLQALDGAVIYFFQNEDLFLDIQYDTGTMQFSAAD